MMNRIIILGAGWLGMPLAERFSHMGWEVEATSRNPAVNPMMRMFKLEQQILVHTLSLSDAYWVCAIPPRATDPQSEYLSLLDEALELSKSMSAKGFLLCSSTGVYDEKDGLYDEKGLLSPAVSRRISVLQEAEMKVLTQNGKVLRLAGLVGPGREPGRFVAGKQLASSANACINMVHQHDVIAAIETLLQHWSKASSIYNLCYPAHPTRQEYYQAHCELLGTDAPTFSRATHERRIIVGSAIEALGFQYQFPI